MQPEQFDKIKKDLNKIITTINNSKINGRKKIDDTNDSHIKNEIDIPKCNTYNDVIEYNTNQLLLYASQNKCEPRFRREAHLDLSIMINCRDDIYNAKFKITYENNYMYQVGPTEHDEKEYLNESIQSNSLVNFINKLIHIYTKIEEVKVSTQYHPIIDTTEILDILNISYKNIEEILGGE